MAPTRARLGCAVLLLLVGNLSACGGSSKTGATTTRAHPASTAAPALKLVWSDEFSGAAGTVPDPQVWEPETGANGWGNNELECYTSAPGNAELNGQGDLVITAIRQPGHVCSDGKKTDYTSARLSTQGRKSFEYGRFEVRAKMPTGSGAWPAFWALGDDHAAVGWPASGEIDVAEVVGKEPQTVHGSLHGPDATGAAYDLTGTHVANTALSDGFHTYSALWTPDRISFAIDGVTYYSVDRTSVTGKWPFDQRFYLLLNLAVGGQFPGSPDASATWPQTMLIDYVRVYQ